MKKQLVLVSLFVLILIIPSLAFAAGETAKSGEAWYTIITGIIAIPAAILGLLVTIKLIRRTSLEVKKLEIEIKEKEKHISETFPAEAVVGVVQPLGESQRALILVLRFVILELALKIWNVVPSAVSYLTGSLSKIVFLYFDKYINERTTAGFAIIFAPYFVPFLLSIVYWVILFGFGWPLFRDTCEFLNIPIKGLFEIPSLGRRSKKGSA